MASRKSTKKVAAVAQSTGLIERPPIVVVMGHVDHGKSSLLDYIRKTNIVDREAGGITQKVGAYEVEVMRGNEQKRITFIDTPGHEAFQGIRARGAATADVAVLVVSAEDGVKPQTIQALKTILEENIPYIVAINKIDKPNADIERTKQSLAENEIYIEGYGGSISAVPISAKTGEGIPDLLEMILLTAELEELRADTGKVCSGFVLEAERDARKGNATTLIITEGTLDAGDYVVAGTSLAPVRLYENFIGKPIRTATFSTPVRVIGWDVLPPVGATFTAFKDKKEAELVIANLKEAQLHAKSKVVEKDYAGKVVVPVIVRSYDSGRLDGVLHELSKIKHDEVVIKILSSGVGNVSEADVKLAVSAPGCAIIGFAVTVDTPARMLAENTGVNIQIHEIIYKLSEWLGEFIKTRIPKKMIMRATGKLKILKTFSRTKDKQIIGGRVIEGSIKNGGTVSITRRENEIGEGKIRELQVQKERAGEVEEGRECGLMVESKIEMTAGDILVSFVMEEQ